ncbi:hypothetical protein M404DRAFT_413617 [Pisolithus tinctorius Marx 270]|uniref:Uncharacterized protein n=1 Tax=Pisolithus tinctorius Marx 270 TaxID=870435 RepID=A0A0C3NEC3_PISTI|nr:hypothetical protein M404DRAFT_413617 [Pisolithus tinctorius Marx 270]
MHPEVAAKVYLQRNCIQPIQDLVKDTELSFVAVSSSAGLEQSLHELIQLTHVNIAETFASQLGTPLPKSAMTASALRMRPRLKIEGSIIVGQQRYWRTLFSCVNLGGRAIVSRLAAIHTDIASVWNFNDPSQYLYSDEFREVMANIAGITNASTPAFSRLPRVATTNFTNE